MSLKFVININKFASIPCYPFAYWATKNTMDIFENNKSLSEYADPRQGFATGDNERFLRLWHEVELNKTQFSSTFSEARYSNKRWFPCNKGGEFRKWYGNNYFVANWENDGFEMKSFKGSVIRNPNYYFRDGGTWSSLSSGSFSMRYSPVGFLFESKGSVCFAKDSNNLNYIIGLLNSVITKKMLLILSPTLDYHEGPVGRIPVIFAEKETVDGLVKDNIETVRDDWNSFEISWDFKKHPLI